MTSPSQLRPPTLAHAPALHRLRMARTRAAAVRQSIEQWAVEIRALTALGLTHTELRGLVARGLVELLEEQTAPGDRARRFLKPRNLAFTERSCFVLTDAGLAAVPAAADRPSWDGHRRLCFRGRLVLHFQRWAPNQMGVLAEFEAKGWPLYIHDPLPGGPDGGCQARLHDAVKMLNRGLGQAPLRFHVIDAGRGVEWEALPRRKK